MHPEVKGLESYFRNCLLNVQAIAFDLKKGRLIGDIGIAALNERMVRVNNKDTLQEYAEAKGFSPIAYIIGVGKSLGFDIEI